MTTPLIEQGLSIEYGWVVPPGKSVAEGFARNIQEADIIRVLKEHANLLLPPGTRYEIRRAAPWNYGRSHGACWYSSPSMADNPAWDVWSRYTRLDGYWLIERCTTPAHT